MAMGAGLSACGLNDPFDVEPPADCSVESQKAWLVDVMNEYYLWNEDLPADIDFEECDSPESLVSSMRQGVDRWTRVRDKTTSDALFMEGKFIGLGYKTLRGPEGEVRLSFVSENSPASAAGLARGDRLVSVNGKTVEELDESGWGDIYGENDPGVDVELEFEKLDTGEIEGMTVTKAWINIVSIPYSGLYDAGGQQVGYYLLDKFVETSKDELESVYKSFKAAGINKLIIDMRYNGGGLISTAERQINLSIGADHNGDTAYRYLYNANYTDENKSTKVDKRSNSIGADQIVVLTSSRTLSASELVISAMLPYAEVVLIGGTTGGKPVGSRSFEFCDKKLFPITFRITNADGFTDYFDGIAPDCYAEDDLFRQLGDPQEGMLAAGLAYFADGACESPPESEFSGGGRIDSIGERVLPNEATRDEVDSW